MFNIVKDTGEDYEIDEETYLGEVFCHLEQMVNNFFDYMFIVHDDNTCDIPKSSKMINHPKKVLIWGSNEDIISPMHKLENDYLHIFSNYYWDTENVTSIPLGYHGSVEMHPTIPMEERLYNMNFVGCLNRNRLKLISSMSKVKDWIIVLGLLAFRKNGLGVLNHLIKCFRNRDHFIFNHSFNVGVDKNLYNLNLSSSKIALCPRGWNNVETFRLYEAMRYGCVVMSEKLPNRSYYSGIPIVEVSDWNLVLSLGDALIEDKDRLKELGEASRRWYEEKLSPRATAEIIANKLKQISVNSNNQEQS